MRCGFLFLRRDRSIPFIGILLAFSRIEKQPDYAKHPVKQASIGSIHNFQPCQIVCLEHENGRLYAEVVQVVTSRQVCWVRPLMLTVLSESGAHPLQASPQQLVLYDLRQGADLVWPITLFRPALDTEVIPLLVQLNVKEASREDALASNKQFSCFVRQVWQAYKSEFQASR